MIVSFILVTIICDSGWYCKEKLNVSHSYWSKGWEILANNNKESQVNNDFRYMNFHISKIIFHLDIYLDPIHWSAPTWLVSSIGRALHRYRRGHGFKSHTGLNFFQVLFTTTRFSSVLSCEDLLISSKHHKTVSLSLFGLIFVDWNNFT